MSSHPHEKRMKPGSTASVPHRPRRSAVECTPPNEVASATSSSAARNALRALRALQREADQRPRVGHLRRGGLPARVADVAHIRVAPQPPRHLRRVGGLAPEPERERGQRAVQHPGLERPRDRPALGAVLAQRAQPTLDRASRPRRARGRSGRRAPWSRCTSRRPRRGRAAAAPAACRACCRPRAGRPRRGPPSAIAGCRPRPARGWTASRSRPSSRPRRRRRSRPCPSARSRISTPRGASRSVATPRTPG